MLSLWQSDAPSSPSDPLPPESEVADVVVIGAGITGLTTALLVARAGRRVVVLEASAPGAGTTGRSTAKVTRLQGSLLGEIRRRTTASALAAYVESQGVAAAWVSEFAASGGVPLDRRDSVTLALGEEGRARVETEHRLARAHGLATTLESHVPELPFEVTAAVRLADQAQVDPVALVAAMTREVRSRGGVVVYPARVSAVTVGGRGPVTVTTDRGRVFGDRVVVATGLPILDRGLYFAKVAPSRSYAAAWRVAEPTVPRVMALAVDGGGPSVRDARGLLLTGGFGHPVGRVASPRVSADRLEQWTREHWPDAEPVQVWSAQDMVSPHRVPFVGAMPRGRGRVFLATGFSKWGMTNAVAAALTLAVDLGIHSERPDWQRALRHRVSLPVAVATGVGTNAAVAAWYARSWTRALRRPVPEAVREGEGALGRRGLTPVGRSRVDGVQRDVCAICPHLGAVVQWNDAEESWDCPAHGSRFDAAGAVLEGPARRGLARR